MWFGGCQEEWTSDSIVAELWRRETTRGSTLRVQKVREEFQPTPVVSEAVWGEVCLGSRSASRGGERELSDDSTGLVSEDRQEDLADVIAADGAACCGEMQDSVGDELGAEATLGWVPPGG